MTKKNLKHSKFLLFVASFFIVFLLIVTSKATFSSLTDSDNKKNDFRLGDLKVKINEEFTPPAKFVPEQEYTKKVTLANTSEQPIFIRVLTSPMLSKKDSDGTTTLLPATTNGTSPILTIDYDTTNWIDGQDGYFYYKKKLLKGQTTPYLFTKVKMNQANITEKYDDVTLTFDLKVEAINCTEYAYRDAWWASDIPKVSPLLDVDNGLKKQTI